MKLKMMRVFAVFGEFLGFCRVPPFLSSTAIYKHFRQGMVIIIVSSIFRGLNVAISYEGGISKKIIQVIALI